MIYLLLGNDTKKKSVYLKKLAGGNQPIFLSVDTTKETFFDYIGSVDLFGEFPIIIAENILNKNGFEFSPMELSQLKDSKTTFVFLEDKLTAIEKKKYQKYATIEDFSMGVLKQAPKMNVFSIAEAFARKDKIETWVLYRNAILLGESPEAISGILFWKIKTMLLSGVKLFSKDELKNKSSELVSLYHRSHLGDCDFVVGLEQFILSSLSK